MKSYNMQNRRLPSYAQNYECKCENIRAMTFESYRGIICALMTMKNEMTVRGCSPISHDNKRETGP